MRILVTGSRGQLGTEADGAAGAADQHEVLGVDLPEHDLTDRDHVLGVITQWEPELVIHGAAFTAVDACEEQVDTAYAVNCAATRFVADGARRVGAHVVYVSTDYVFDGTKDSPYVEWDRPNPQSVYGRTKLGGEMEIDPGWTIARTSWVCGFHGNNMVKTLLRLAEERDTVSFVDDQWGHPTFAQDLAAMVTKLGVERVPGVFHTTNQGAVSWYGFAQAVFAAAGHDPNRVSPHHHRRAGSATARASPGQLRARQHGMADARVSPEQGLPRASCRGGRAAAVVMSPGALPAGPTSAPRWWLWVAFAGFAVSFVTWSLASPLGSIPDEPAHVIRAAAVWQGQMSGDTVELPPDPSVPDLEITATQVRVPAYYGRLGELPGCHAGKPAVAADCSPSLEADGTLIDTVTTAGIYTPAFYALVGWPSRMFSSSVGVYAMRAVSALVCAVLLTLALACLQRVIDRRLALMALWVAATPMLHYLAGSVNPNGVEVAAAMAAWAAALATCGAAARQELDRFALVGFVVASVLMVPMRTLGPLYLLGIVAVAVVFMGPRCVRDLARRPSVWVGAAVVGGVALASVAWTIVSDPVGNTTGSLAPQNENIVIWLLGAVDDWYRQMIAVFGWLDTGPVVLVVALWSAAVVLLMALGALGGRPWRVVGLAAVLFAALFTPVIIQSQIAAEHGINWQGRYLLPVAVGVPLLAVLAASDSQLLSKLPLRRLELMVYSACGIALIISHVVVMQRYVTGVIPLTAEGPGPVQNYLVADGWSPPLPKLFLLVLAAIGALWTIVIVFVTPERVRRRPRLRNIQEFDPVADEQR